MRRWQLFCGIAVLAVAVESPATGHSGPGLRVSIEAGSGLATVLVFENLSLEAIDFPVSASVLLGQEEPLSYWAPFDPMTGAPYEGAVRIMPGKPIPPPPVPTRLRLASGQSLRIKVDLRDLPWARRISSVWPDQQFDALVPSRTYILVLEVSGEALEAEVRSSALYGPSAVELAGTSRCRQAEGSGRPARRSVECVPERTGAVIRADEHRQLVERVERAVRRRRARDRPQQASPRRST